MWAETCSNDNTYLNKGHADIVAYKGVFIYFLRYSATGCTNQELRLKETGKSGAKKTCGLRSRRIETIKDEWGVLRYTLSMFQEHSSTAQNSSHLHGSVESFLQISQSSQ
jgi:hypothetical protein